MIEILMATYNSARYLDAQINSLFQQTYPHFVLTIRDNRSTDATIDIIKQWQVRYPHRIQLHVAAEHGDALSNFSALLSLSQRDYLAFSDSDDVWVPDKLAISMHCLKQLEQQHGKQASCLVYTDLTPTDAELRPLSPSFWKESGFPPIIPTFSQALMRNRLTGCTILCNRALADLADPIPQEAIMHDAWLGLVATAFGHLMCINTPAVLYRQHASNQLGSLSCNPLRLMHQGKLPLLWRRRRQPHGRFIQAETFLERYAPKLSCKEKESVEMFLKLPSSSWIEAIKLMKRHQFYEPTWMWTLYTLLFRLTTH